MKPTKKLILALRETALQLINESVEYNWWCSRKCNCGLLAINLGLEIDKNVYVGSWAEAARNTIYCHVTNHLLSKIFNFLLSCGLEKEDFEKIELLDYSTRD